MYAVVGLNQFLFQGLPPFQLVHIEAYIFTVRLLNLSSNNWDR